MACHLLGIQAVNRVLLRHCLSAHLLVLDDVGLRQGFDGATAPRPFLGCKCNSPKATSPQYWPEFKVAETPGSIRRRRQLLQLQMCLVSHAFFRTRKTVHKQPHKHIAVGKQ